jgi:hypothetical protein
MSPAQYRDALTWLNLSHVAAARGTASWDHTGNGMAVRASGIQQLFSTPFQNISDGISFALIGRPKHCFGRCHYVVLWFIDAVFRKLRSVRQQLVNIY